MLPEHDLLAGAWVPHSHLAVPRCRREGRARVQPREALHTRIVPQYAARPVARSRGVPDCGTVPTGCRKPRLVWRERDVLYDIAEVKLLRSAGRQVPEVCRATGAPRRDATPGAGVHDLEQLIFLVAEHTFGRRDDIPDP